MEETAKLVIYLNLVWHHPDYTAKARCDARGLMEKITSGKQLFVELPESFETFGMDGMDREYREKML